MNKTYNFENIIFGFFKCKYCTSHDLEMNVCILKCKFLVNSYLLQKRYNILRSSVLFYIIDTERNLIII